MFAYFGFKSLVINFIYYKQLQFYCNIYTWVDCVSLISQANILASYGEFSKSDMCRYSVAIGK